MAEFITDDDGAQIVAATVWDDPDVPPPADPQLAPKGWAWNRAARQWKPRQRAIAGNPEPRPGRGRPRGRSDKTGPGRQAPQQQRSLIAGLLRRDPPPDVDDQADDTGDRDPDPGWMLDDAPPPPDPWDPSTVGDDIKDDIAGMLGLLYSIPADFLITVDPYCFCALNANLEATIDATVPIICRSKRAVEFVTGASGLILWIKLLATLKPFFVALWQHHVIHSVDLEQDQETGKVTAMKQDFSAYTAA